MTNAEARFSISLRPRKPEGSLGRTAQEATATFTQILKSRFEDVPLVAFMYLAFTRMPGESYRWRHRSLLLWLCDVFEI